MRLKDYRRILHARSMDELKARHGPPRSTTGRIPAYINHGRWVADCTGCGSGVACGPDSPDAICVECKRVWRIAFPGEKAIEQADDVLGARPTRLQNWRPDQGETVDDLKAENLLKGLPITAPALPVLP